MTLNNRLRPDMMPLEATERGEGYPYKKEVRMTRMKLAAWLVLTGFAVKIASADDAVLARFGRINTDLIVSEQIFEAEGPFAARNITRHEIPRDIERAIAELKEHLGLLGDGEIEVIHVPGAKAVERAAERAAGRAVIVLGGPETDRAFVLRGRVPNEL